jgi:hypothetical protein
MSKHFFSAPNSQGVTLVAECGYDRQLNQFDLSLNSEVALEQDEEEEEGAVDFVDSPVFYTSLMERGGGISLEALREQCAKRGVELPEGLYFELNAEKEADIRTNYAVQWPLYGAQLANLNQRVMLAHIASELCNNEEDSDETIIAYLHEQYPSLELDKLKTIVTVEREHLRRFWWDGIDWTKYELQPAYKLVGLVPTKQA